MLQVFNYNENGITFKSEAGVTYVNATEMAKPFGKRANDYLRNASSIEFINEISSSAGKRVDEMILVKEGGNGGGTWMHEDIALDFAMWLSPQFRVWCNQRIKELMTVGMTATAPTIEALVDNPDLIITLATQLKELRATVNRQAEKVDYHDKVIAAQGAFPITIIAKELGMSAIKLNQELHRLGVQWKVGGVWELTAKYQNLGYTKVRTVVINEGAGTGDTRHQTLWTEKGRQFIHSMVKIAA